VLRTKVPIVASVLLLAACGGSAPRRREIPPPSAEIKALIRTAKSYLPEEEGGRETPKDCSDFVSKVFAEHGVKLPRHSEGMVRVGEGVSSSRELRMGDLVFFAGKKGGKRIGHVGIFVNNGIFIHQANPGEGVRQESLFSDYYRARYRKARRVMD
jgi:cell wall-associated NlpC family hydrolase